MSPRSIRRAAERQAAKDAIKQAKPAGTAATASEAQLAANRANAQLAHGPTSPEGRAISSRNHTTHGLTSEPSGNFKVLPGEDQSAYDASLAAFQSEWNPTTATEHDLVTRLATHAWLRDRAIRFQNQILTDSGGYEMTTEVRKQFELFARYYATHSRSFGKTFSEIMRLRNFHLRQQNAAAILERRTLDIQIRFESQKRAAEVHAAKMEMVRLKQEAIKQRNQRSSKPEPTSQSVSHAPEQAQSQSA